MTKARDIASAAPAPSTVSATELGYLDGVTSAIQTQLDAKTAKSTLTTTGDIYYASSANTPARLGIGSTGNVLTVASGIPSWAAPATPASGLTLISDTTYSAVSSQSVNSVFSSTYRNYKIFISVTGTAAAQSSLRLRASGTDNSNSEYGQESDFSSRSTGTSWQLMRIDVSRGGTAVIDMINPFATDNTYFNNQTLGADDTNVDAQYIAGRTTVTTSYDGFTIFPQSGTITGRITVYGYGI
jgi:hypothetical protein